jgi:hypothetical protein
MQSVVGRHSEQFVGQHAVKLIAMALGTQATCQSYQTIVAAVVGCTL